MMVGFNWQLLATGGSVTQFLKYSPGVRLLPSQHDGRVKSEHEHQGKHGAMGGSLTRCAHLPPGFMPSHHMQSINSI